ncbi:Sulfonate/nitrate/taurine transport system substrate-binding protein, partial [Pseudomonas savastanoi pv. glycinea]
GREPAVRQYRAPDRQALGHAALKHRLFLNNQGGNHMTTTFHRPALTVLAATLGLFGALLSSGVQAEGKISIAQQFGIGYLILDVVRDQKLIEKHG